MSFAEAVRTVYRKYADFSGRAPLSEYWWFQLFLVLVMIAGVAGGVLVSSITRTSAAGSMALLALGAFLLLTIIPSLAVIVRRLHDSDKSGAWLLLAFLPFGSIILLILMLLPSSEGVNNYGPPFGMGGEILQAQFPGPTRAEAWARFTEDAPKAAAVGYRAVGHRWRIHGNTEFLEVTYQRPVDPTWRPPGQAAS
jgi:uncharacterized membrane protein YhaH (DUF805 family)